jgi:hypothetical protein
VEGHCAAWTSHASRTAVTRLGVGERKRRRKGKKIKGREEKEEKKKKEDRKINYLFFRNYDL